MALSSSLLHAAMCVCMCDVCMYLHVLSYLKYVLSLVIHVEVGCADMCVESGHTCGGWMC